MGDDRAEDVIEAWAESAQYWDKHYKVIRAMFGPVTDALVEAARIAAGQRVLDVAGGSGEPSLTLAGLVGPGGHIDYADPVTGMMEVAERQALKRGLTNIMFHCAPAESLPFGASSFDAITCRFGAMFFADALQGLKEMLRVLKPGGIMALAVWRARELNPFFATVADIVAKHIEAPPEDPNALGAFRFASPGSLSGLLEAAGASDVSESILKFSIQAPIALSEFWTTRVEMSDTLRGKVASLTPEQLESARREVTEAAAPYFGSGTLNTPAQAFIVSGSRES